MQDTSDAICPYCESAIVNGDYTMYGGSMIHKRCLTEFQDSLPLEPLIIIFPGTKELLNHDEDMSSTQSQNGRTSSLCKP